MNGDPSASARLDQARREYTDARRSVEQLRTSAAASEADLKRLSRIHAGDDRRLRNAKLAHENQLKLLGAAQARQRAAQAALDKARAEFLPADPANDVAKLAAEFPIVLMPVRIETRFAQESPTHPAPARPPAPSRPPAPRPGSVLKIRIYPDELMADTHEPPLTANERGAGMLFWRTGWQVEKERGAWRTLVAMFPAPRSAWIARALTPLNLASRPVGEPVFPDTPGRPHSWTRAAETRVLPDRWIVIAYRGGREVSRAVGLAIQSPLALSLNPMADDNDAGTVAVSSDGLRLDAELAWTVDFAQAVKVGMAVTLPLEAADLTHGFDRLIVVGVKSALVAAEAAERLAELLDSHHYGRGLAFVPQGTPTNNTGDAPSGFPVTDFDGAVSFAVERGGPLTGPESNGTLLARALGVREELAGHLAGSALREQPGARAMNEVLWPVTWGYFLEHMMEPVLPAEAIRLGRGHFSSHVRGRGPLPTFRTGATPYGVLPVGSLNRWSAPAVGGGVEGHLAPLLRSLREIWLEQVPQVPRVGATENADDDMLAVLGMDSGAREARLRPVLGPQMQSQLFAALNMNASTWLSRQRAISQGVMKRLGHPEWNPRIGAMSFADGAHLVGGPFVGNAPLSESEPLQPFNYINWIRTASLTQLRQEELPRGIARPSALLYHLLRHAALSLYAGVATKVAIKHNAASHGDGSEPELQGFGAPGPVRPTVWQRLDQKIPQVTGNATLGNFLLTDRHGEEAKDIRAFRAALAALENLPTAELDRLFTETLDTCSHRLDAWITSLPAKRLEEMRHRRPLGSHLGAFGWVEDLRPDPVRPAVEPASSGGFIHAPSASHAAAAAILRNAYLSRSGQDSARYAVDLSSARVRGALELLDAVRQGQPLGAVLGYRFERGLHEAPRPLEKYIDPFRKLYPLVADKGGVSGEPVESIAARNVVDGLLLRAAWQPPGTIPFGQHGLPAGGDDRNAIEAELALLDDAVDAVADLLTAESVFQLVRGNSAKATATMDAIGQGLRPPEPEIALQPRGGTTLTHRVVVVLGGEPLPAGAWSALTETPRSLVEPYLDHWAGSLLGDPTNALCRLGFLDQANQRTVRTVSLAELGLRPLDLLALAGSFGSQPTASELDARIASLAPDSATGVEIQYAADPSWDRALIRTFPDILELARAINAFVGRSRPLDPGDLLPPEEAQAADGADQMPAEAMQRAAAAEAALSSAQSRLQVALQTSPPDLTVLHEGLRAAALLGIPGAYPKARGPGDATRDELAAQASSVLAELERRGTASGAATNAVEKARAVFGRDFVFLPRFRLANPGEMELALSHGPALIGEASAVTKWMQQASRMRAPLACWRQLSLTTEVLGHAQLPLNVAQLPHVPGARWVGLAFPTEKERPPSGRLSLVLHRAVAPPASSPWVGLLLDEWSEIIPNPTEDTAIAFHYDDPGAEAAQAVLIAVPPTEAPRWDLDTLLDILNETLDLAKVRAVDNELLPLGQILPAIYLAANPSKDTVSTDLRPILQRSPEAHV